MIECAFKLRATRGIPYYSCIALEKMPGLHHGFSTRSGGRGGQPDRSFNLGNAARDSEEGIAENRRQFLSALNLPGTPLVTLRQIHSNQVHIIKEFSGQWNPPEGDAVVTRLKNLALSVQTADCLPVLIADPENESIAAVHSGWRGTLKQVAIRTIEKMQSAAGSKPERLIVAIGPGIRSCCFEVGPEVADAFSREYPGETVHLPAPDRPGKFLLDLPGILQIQFRLAGIRPERIHDSGLCTLCKTDTFFSYRAEGSGTGRMMAVIGWK
jgi:YfiH family protein